MIRLSEAAERLGLHIDTLRYHAHTKGKMKSEFRGGLLYISLEDVQRIAPHVLRHGTRAFSRFANTKN